MLNVISSETHSKRWNNIWHYITVYLFKSSTVCVMRAVFGILLAVFEHSGRQTTPAPLCALLIAMAVME